MTSHSPNSYGVTWWKWAANQLYKWKLQDAQEYQLLLMIYLFITKNQEKEKGKQTDHIGLVIDN